MSPATWEEAAEETADTLSRDVIQKWTEANVDPLNATRQVLARMGDEPGQYPAVQGFRHIAENGIVGYLKHAVTNITEDQIELSVSHVVQTIIKKQHDYGHGNIEAYGRLGLLVRLSDKCARIENLVKRAALQVDNLQQRGSTAMNESLEDSWLDIAGYGIIGCMWEDGSFLLPLAADVPVDIAKQKAEYLPENIPPVFDEREEERIKELALEKMIAHGMFPGLTSLDRTIP